MQLDKLTWASRPEDLLEPAQRLLQGLQGIQEHVFITELQVAR